MPEEMEPYFKILERWGTPEEIRAVFEKIGRPKDVLARHDEVTTLLEGNGRRRWLISSAKEMAAWISVVGGAIVLLAAVYSSFIRPVPRTSSPPVAVEKIE